MYTQRMNERKGKTKTRALLLCVSSVRVISCFLFLLLRFFSVRRYQRQPADSSFLYPHISVLMEKRFGKKWREELVLDPR